MPLKSLQIEKTHSSTHRTPISEIEKTRIPGPSCLIHVMKHEKRSSGDLRALSLKLKKGGSRWSSSLILEGDSHLPMLKLKNGVDMPHYSYL